MEVVVKDIINSFTRKGVTLLQIHPNVSEEGKMLLYMLMEQSMGRTRQIVNIDYPKDNYTGKILYVTYIISKKLSHLLRVDKAFDVTIKQLDTIGLNTTVIAHTDDDINGIYDSHYIFRENTIANKYQLLNDMPEYQVPYEAIIREYKLSVLAK